MLDGGKMKHMESNEIVLSNGGARCSICGYRAPYGTVLWHFALVHVLIFGAAAALFILP
jgi:hypothetical protein